MKIVLVIPRLHQGGAQRQVYETAKLLARDGHEINVLVYDLAAQHFTFADDQIRIIELDPGNTYTRCRSLYNALKTIQPDYVISYLEKANKYLGMVGLFSRLKKRSVFLASERNTVLRYSFSFLKRIYFRLIYQGIDGIIVNSSITKMMLGKKLGFDENRIYLLRNVLNVQDFLPLAIPREDVKKLSPAIDPERLLILVPARICRQKNQKILLGTAAELVVSGFDQFQFLMVGSQRGSYFDSFQKMVDREGYNDHFVQIGTIADDRMIDIYNLSDIVLLPSLYEGFPNVIIEAMACGKIVITTDTSDLEHLVHNGQNGFVVPVNSSEAITRTILEITRLSPDQRATITSHACETASNFEPRVFLQSFYHILASHPVPLNSRRQSRIKQQA